MYNFVTTEILVVFDNGSPELLRLYLNYCDYFVYDTLGRPVCMQPTCATDPYAHRQLLQHFHSIRAARDGGTVVATRRILNALPSYAQVSTHGNRAVGRRPISRLTVPGGGSRATPAPTLIRPSLSTTLEPLRRSSGPSCASIPSCTFTRARCGRSAVSGRAARRR